jgi:hypothetical protein
MPSQEFYPPGTNLCRVARLQQFASCGTKSLPHQVGIGKRAASLVGKGPSYLRAVRSESPASRVVWIKEWPACPAAKSM